MLDHNGHSVPIPRSAVTISPSEPGPTWVPYPADQPATGWHGPTDEVESGSTAAMFRLRQHLRSSVATHLPARVPDSDQSTDLAALERKRSIAVSIAAEALQAHNEAEVMANHPLLPDALQQQVVRETLDELFGFGRLQPLLDDPTIETINVNRFDQVFLQHTDGRRTRAAPIASSDEELTGLVRMIAARSGSEERRLDRSSPILNLELPGGQRLCAITALTKGGSTALSIRRYPHRHFALDHTVAEFLGAAVVARKNILITGGTSVGKTTLLRTLAAFIPEQERLITIEDAFELGLGLVRSDVIALQAREANIEGQGALSQSDLVRMALRLCPDRVIVGEIRGPEVIPMCNAMSQGNDGSLATVHASSSQVAFGRLASYAAQGPERLSMEATNLLVAGAVHLVVHLERAADRVTRVVSSIREVIGSDGNQVISSEIFRPGADRRATAVPGVLRAGTLAELIDVGFDPRLLESPESGWNS